MGRPLHSLLCTAAMVVASCAFAGAALAASRAPLPRAANDNFKAIDGDLAGTAWTGSAGSSAQLSLVHSAEPLAQRVEQSRLNGAQKTEAAWLLEADGVPMEGGRGEDGAVVRETRATHYERLAFHYFDPSSARNSAQALRKSKIVEWRAGLGTLTTVIDHRSGTTTKTGQALDGSGRRTTYQLRAPPGAKVDHVLTSDGPL